MSQAASQAMKFYQDVAASRRVFSFLDQGNLLVFVIQGYEVVPFWSSASRMKSIQKAHPRYRTFAIDDASLESFLEVTLEKLEQSGIHVGVNWSGAGLTGYDLPVPDLRRNLQYWIDRLA